MTTQSQKSDYLVIEHLRLISNIIDRLSKFSFQIKAWNISVLGLIVVFLVNASDVDLYMTAWVILAIVIIFIILSAYYLSIEKRFKVIYENASNGNYTNYRMPSLEKPLKRFIKAFISPAVFLFYGPEVIFVVILIITSHSS